MRMKPFLHHHPAKRPKELLLQRKAKPKCQQQTSLIFIPPLSKTNQLSQHLREGNHSLRCQSQHLQWTQPPQIVKEVMWPSLERSEPPQRQCSGWLSLPKGGLDSVAHLKKGCFLTLSVSFLSFCKSDLCSACFVMFVTFLLIL